jgi:hypothetical protein
MDHSTTAVESEGEDYEDYTIPDIPYNGYISGEGTLLNPLFFPKLGQLQQ